MSLLRSDSLSLPSRAGSTQRQEGHWAARYVRDIVMDARWSMNASDVGQKRARDYDNVPTVARELGGWGFRRVESGQLPTTVRAVTRVRT